MGHVWPQSRPLPAPLSPALALVTVAGPGQKPKAALSPQRADQIGSGSGWGQIPTHGAVSFQHGAARSRSWGPLIRTLSSEPEYLAFTPMCPKRPNEGRRGPHGAQGPTGICPTAWGRAEQDRVKGTCACQRRKKRDSIRVCPTTATPRAHGNDLL